MLLPVVHDERVFVAKIREHTAQVALEWLVGDQMGLHVAVAAEFRLFRAAADEAYAVEGSDFF